MVKVCWYVANIIFAGGVVATAYFGLLPLVCRWKCRKEGYGPDKPCHDRGCKYAEYCKHYIHQYTPDELEDLRRMADEMGER